MSASTTTLGEAVDFIRNGLAISNRNGVGGLPITRIETISDHQVDPERVGYAGVQIGERDDWLLRPGDILFSHINSVTHLGKCALYDGVPEHLLHGMNLLSIRANPQRLLPRFLLRALRSTEFRAQLAKHVKPAVNQASVSIASLRTVRIPVPSLPEQRRIADILDKADAIRVKRKQAIALTEGLLRSAFLDMFGDPVTNPKGWPTQPLAELATDISDGTHKTPSYVQSGIPFLSAKNVRAHRINWERTKFITREEHRDLIRRCHPQLGDVVLTKSGTIGEAAVIDRDTEFSLFESVALIKLRSGGVSPHFLAELLNNPSIRKLYGADVKGVGVKHLHLVDIRRLRTICPPEDLQERYARAVDRLHKAQHTVERSWTTTEVLFKALVQRSFGRRV